MPLSKFLGFVFVVAMALSSLGVAGAVHAQTTVGNGNTGAGITVGTGNTSTGSNCGSTGGTTIANPLKFCDLDSLLNAILAAAISLGTVILTLALIYTGFLFVAARGNEAKLTKAKSALLYTIIGGLILFGATAIKTVITDTVTSLSP